MTAYNITDRMSPGIRHLTSDACKSETITEPHARYVTTLVTSDHNIIAE